MFEVQSTVTEIAICFGAHLELLAKLLLHPFDSIYLIELASGNRDLLQLLITINVKAVKMLAVADKCNFRVSELLKTKEWELANFRDEVLIFNPLVACFD